MLSRSSSSGSSSNGSRTSASGRWSLSLRGRLRRDKTPADDAQPVRHRKKLSAIDWRSLSLRRKSDGNSSSSSTSASDSPATRPAGHLSSRSSSPTSSLDLGPPRSPSPPASSIYKGKNKGDVKSRAKVSQLSPASSFDDFGVPLSDYKHAQEAEKTEFSVSRKMLFTDRPPTLSPASTFNLGSRSSSPSPASSIIRGKNKNGIKIGGVSAGIFDDAAAPPSPVSSSSEGKNKDGLKKMRRRLLPHWRSVSSTSTAADPEDAAGTDSVDQKDAMLFTDSPPTLSPTSTFDLGAAPPSPASSIHTGKNKDGTEKRQRRLLGFGPLRRASSSSDEDGSPSATIIADRKDKGRADSPSVDEKHVQDSPYTFSLERSSTFASSSTSPHVYPPIRRRVPRRANTDGDVLDDKRMTYSIAETEDDTAVVSPTSSSGIDARPRPPRPPHRHTSPTARETTLAVASLTFRALREVADGLNIPYAKGIAGLAVLITDSVAQVTTNNEACERLADHVCQVVSAIINQMNGKDNISPQLKYNIEHLTQTLTKIHKFVQDQAKRSYVSRFMRSQDDVAVIQEYGNDLRHALDLFGLRSTILIQHQLHRSAAMAQEYDTKILKTVKRNHAIYMSAIRGSGSPDETDAVPEEDADAGATQTVAESPAIDWEEPMLHPRPQIFFGRDAVLGDIISALAPAEGESSGSGAARLAVLGAPGIGKSSLALSALHHARTVARYSSRRYFVACDAASDAASLLRVLVAFFELTVRTGMDEASVQDTVLSRLRGRGEPALLVLDNIEHAWEAPATRDSVEKVLAAIAGLHNVTLIVTLRGAERPMGPGWTRPFLPPIGPLDADAARKTFIAVSDVAEDEPLLPKLLDRCAGHPLAIKLLAGIAQYDSMSALLARWDQESTALLESGGLSRRMNFDVSIAESVSGARMRDAGQPALDLMALLCTVPDGFSEETLQALAKRDPELDKAVSVLRQTALAYDDSIKIMPPAPLPAAALAASPTAKFLETHKGSSEPRVVRRLCVFGPIRAHFASNYKPKAAHVEVLEAHYITLAARAALIGTAEDDEMQAQVLRLEVGNMHCMIERILETNPHRRDAVQAAADLGAFLRHTLHGSLRSSSFQLALKASEAIGEESLKGEWMVRAAEAAHERGDVQSAVAGFAAAKAVLHDVRGQAHCLKQWGLALVETKESALAVQKLEEARALYRDAGDSAGQGECLVHLAKCAIEEDNTARAQSHAEEAMRIFRKNAHITWQARCQKVLGIVAQRNGNLKLAATKFSSALTLFKKAGCAPEVADALGRLAQIASARGDFADAQSTNDDVLTMVRGFGRLGSSAPAAPAPAATVNPVNRQREAQALLELGKLALMLDNFDLARTRFEEAAAIFSEAPGDSTSKALGQAACTVGLGDLSFKIGDLEDALARYHSAHMTYRSVRALRSEAEVLAKIGDAQHAQETDINAGLVAHVTSLVLYRKTRTESGMASELRWLGDYTLASGEPRDALTTYHVAGTLCRRAIDWRLSADVHARIGDVCLGFGNSDGARTRYESALSLYRKGSDRQSSQLCQEKLSELS